ncbi:hypothetical protein [Sphingobacterium sp. NPDC055346]
MALAYRSFTFAPPSCRPDEGRISEFYRHINCGWHWRTGPQSSIENDKVMGEKRTDSSLIVQNQNTLLRDSERSEESIF